MLAVIIQCELRVMSVFPKILLLSGAILLTLQPSFAAVSMRDSYQYTQCLQRIESDPNGAFNQALAWGDEGGGAAAEHCASLALLALGQEEDAALRLERVAISPGAGDEKARAEILSQAGQAWIAAGRPQEADTVLTSAIALDPDNAAFFLDRAHTHRMRGDNSSAMDDLTAAITINRRYTEAFVMRATLRRMMGDLAGAKKDVERALEIDSQNIEALVERGRQAEISAGRFVE